MSNSDEKQKLFEQATILDGKANSISHSFGEVKKNPLELNNLMKHVMLLSSLLHEHYTEEAKRLRQEAEAIGKEVMD